MTAEGPEALAPTADPSADRLGMGQLAVDVVRRPSAAMARIALRPKRRWLPPLVALALLAVPIGFMTAQRAQVEARAQMADRAEDMSDAQRASVEGAMRMGSVVGGVSAVVAGVFGTFLVAVIGAAVLHFLATIFGGQQTFAEVLATASWARVPLVIRGALQVAFLAAGGHDPNLAGLSGLVAPAGTALGGQRSYLEPVLAQVELWNLWYLALLVVAVGVVAKFPRRRAAAVVGVYAALAIGVGMVAVATANAAQGLFGG